MFLRSNALELGFGVIGETILVAVAIVAVAIPFATGATFLAGLFCGDFISQV
jgi:hypothetical protein